MTPPRSIAQRITAIICLAIASPAIAEDGDAIPSHLARLEFVQPRQEPVAEHTRVQFGDPGARHRPAGYFARISGMSVELDDDADLRGGGSVDTETGFGLSFGAGFKHPEMPLVIEVEYLFRRFETERYTDPETGERGDNRMTSHIFAANLLFDAPAIAGPVGVYAGAGIGFRISQFSFSTSSTGQSGTQVSGEDLYWQAMGGLTITLQEHMQLYGGVRWVDGGDQRNGSLTVDTQSFSIEVGFRFYF